MIAKIAKSKIDEWFDRVKRGYKIYAPVSSDDSVQFREVDKYAQIEADAIASTMSAKALIYPQSRTLFRFIRSPEGWSIESPENKADDIMIFGIRPCDLHAMKVLRRNFIRDDFTDSDLAARLDKIATVVITCNEPLSTCFCTSVGGSPAECGKADVLLTDLGEYYLAESQTETGDELVNMAGDIFEDAADADKHEAEAKKQAGLAKVPAIFDYKEAAAKLGDMFESPYWQKAVEKCLSCGYCTFTCPTCYCFNITDERVSDDESERLATWDACMFYGFTRMAGGHNPRNDKYRRFRQRALHKFRYFVNNYDFAACVGCGRCIQGCPVGIDISKVIKGAIEQSEQ